MTTTNPYKFLQHIVFINLEKRTDRLAEINAEMAKMGLVAERFNAISRPIGNIGCFLSHLAVLKMAKINRWPQVLILEDDFTFVMEKEEFLEQMEALNDYATRHQFDVCFLSYNMQRSTEIPSETHFIRALDCQTASGYIVKQHYYDKLIELYEWAMPLLESTGQHWNYANDQVWKRYQSTDNWIAFKKRIGKQRPSFSDNSGCFTDYNV